jgi:multiple sugar transport system permease protein
MRNLAQESVPSRRGARRRSQRSRQNLLGWILVLPATTVLLIMFVIPVCFLIWISFHKWPLIGEKPKFILFDNYSTITDNTLFMDSITFTIKYMILILILLITISFMLALLVQENKIKINGVLRTGFFLPVVTGLSTASLLFLGMFNSIIGPIPNLLKHIGVNWDFLATENTALTSTLVMMTWRFAGFYMIILLAGLHAIPVELYESAQVDGASRLQTLRKITVPLLKPSLAMSIVLITTGGLVAFEQFYIITAGGPDNSTVTMVMTIFREAFSQFNLGSAAAMSVILLIALILVNVTQIRLLRNNVKEA